MKSIYLCLLLPVFIYSTSVAQIKKARNSPRDFGYSTFTIKGTQDKINFVVSDTLLDHKKPIFLFCQGSLPTALFWKEDETHTWESLINFDYKPYLKDYNFVIINKPGIEVFSHTADKDYMYIDPVTKLIPQEYLDKNYFDYYVTQANDVLNYLAKQKWVDASNMVICGISQGSKVVSKLGVINKHVSKVVYLSGNPLGRFDQNIRQLRKDAVLGKITNEQAQAEINKLYTQWELINKTPDNTHSIGGDTNKAWTTFSAPTLSYLLKINVPLFIGYGTADNAADYCDLLPLDFIRLGKHNYTMKPYLGYDHNFNKITFDAKGNKIASEERWPEVAKDIFEWLKQPLVKM